MFKLPPLMLHVAHAAPDQTFDGMKMGREFMTALAFFDSGAIYQNFLALLRSNI